TPNHHEAAVEAHAELAFYAVWRPEVGVMGVQGLSEGERGQDRPSGMILMGKWCPEEGHKAIAQELVDGAFVPVHFLQCQVKEAVQQDVHVVGANLCGDGGRVL